jgi:hypothetical protein
MFQRSLGVSRCTVSRARRGGIVLRIVDIAKEKERLSRSASFILDLLHGSSKPRVTYSRIEYN